MASNVIKVSIVADSKGFEAGIKKSDAVVGGFFAGMGAKIGTFALDLGRRALGAVKEFVADSVRAFSDLEQATGGTEAVFGSLSDEIGRVAKTAATSMGLSETEFRTATTSMGGQLKRMTGDVDLAADKSIFLTQVAADLAATYGGTTAEAVAALGAAFRGEADPAERFNLNLKIGAQNAKAVEMGLAATTSEVDDHARALALVELITEQSADAQGQFARELDTVAGKQAVVNAKLENAKALLGQSLAPAKNLFQGLQLWGVNTLVDLAKWFGEWTGEMGASQAALVELQQQLEYGKEPMVAITDALQEQSAQFSVLTDWVHQYNLGNEALADRVGNAERSLFALLGQAKDLGVEIPELVRHWETMNRQGLISDELFQWLKDSTEAWQESTKQQSQDLAILNSVTERYTNRAKDAGDATLDLAAATEYSRQKMVEFREEQKRGLDVSSDFITALDRQKEAQEAYTEAVKEHGPASEEAQEAALEMAEANGAVIDSALAVAEQYPDVFEGMFQELLDSGVAPATARAIVDQAQAQFDNNPIHVRLAVQPVKWTQQGQSAIPVKDGPRQIMHRGGIVPGIPGEEVPALLEAGEVVLPREVTRKIGRPTPTSAPMVINLAVSSLDPRESYRLVLEALQEIERRFGGIPVNVRPG